MSWPDDGIPRFVVSTVSGHRINPASGRDSSGSKVMPTCSYVLDRAYAHRIVAAFETVGNRWKRNSNSWLEAVSYAAVLNERDQLDEERAA